MNSALIAIIIGLCGSTSEAGECVTRGRFPNMLSNDCRGYTMCLSVLNNFTRIDLVCPEHSIYSHMDNQCTNITTYQCLPKFNCTKVGDFPNPSRNDCMSYISCFEALDEIMTARLVECPSDMLFNPVESICVNNTLFSCDPTTPEPPSVLEVSVEISAVDNGIYSIHSANVKTYCVMFICLIYFIIF